ncbi:MAG: glycosyltransferase family 2 protein [Actinomycetota bacterium]|nr:glycosyltransferase family 2 protein [Actinomycetota bacterium]
MVILNWRTPEYTVRAARALMADGVQPARLVIVDNGSGDGSVERFRRELTRCRILPLADNIGFARANNAGARQLPGSQGYLFVNSDAFLHRPGTVSHLVEALEDPNVGIVFPRLRNVDLSTQRNVVPFSSPLPALVRASGLSRFVPNRIQPRLATHWDHSTSRRIQAANGAVVLVRAAAWRQLGGFNEQTFMYVEDLDLCRRAAGLGWTARFVAEAEFIHLGGASSAQRWGDAERAERMARIEAELLGHYMGPARTRLTIAVMAAGVGVRAVWYRLRGNQEAATVQRAWLRGYLSPGR